MKSIVLGLVIQKLPAFIMKRIYTLDELKRDIDISLRGTEHPIYFHLKHDIPRVGVWFRLTNLSYLDIEIEIFFVSLWLKGKGEVLKEETHFREPRIAARSIRDMLWEVQLNPFQVKKINGYFEEVKEDARCELDIEAKISSAFGRLSMRMNIGNVKCK